MRTFIGKDDMLFSKGYYGIYIMAINLVKNKLNDVQRPFSVYGEPKKVKNMRTIRGARYELLFRRLL